MNANNQQATIVSTPSDREILVERVFNAPRDLVWKAWTTPEHVSRWFGPRGWTTTVKQMDVKPGGVWVYCMKSESDGQESCGRAEYHEVAPPERLVYTDYFADADGNPSAGMPAGRVTLTFQEQDGKTKVSNTVLYPTKEDRDRVLQMGMSEGTAETLDRLEKYLATL